MELKQRMSVVGPVLMFTAVGAFAVGGYVAFGMLGGVIGVVVGGLVGLLEIRFLERLFAKGSAGGSSSGAGSSRAKHEQESGQDHE